MAERARQLALIAPSASPEEAAAAISRRKMVLTAPAAPITAISAVGHARLISARMCLDAMTS